MMGLAIASLPEGFICIVALGKRLRDLAEILGLQRDIVRDPLGLVMDTIIQCSIISITRPS